MAIKDKKAFLTQSLNVGKAPVVRKTEFRSINISQNTMSAINKLRQINIEPTCVVVDFVIKEFSTRALTDDDFVEDMYSEQKNIMIWKTTREMIRVKCAEISIAHGGQIVSVNKLIQLALKQYLKAHS